MPKKYLERVGERNFLVIKDYYFGNWSICLADECGNTVLGAAPFSIGHRTKEEALEYIRKISG